MKTFYINSKSLKEQFEKEEIDSQIKEVKKEVKVFDFLNDFVLNIQKDEFKRKLYKINNLLNNSYTQYYSQICLVSKGEFIENKITLLERLKSLSEKIILSPINDDIKVFNQLQNELQHYLSNYEQFRYGFECHFYNSYFSEIKKELLSKLNLLRSRFRYLVKRTPKKNVILDIRMLFRKIIKFLFKNMGDEDSLLNVLNFNFSKIFNNSLIYILNEQRTNGPTFGSYNFS